MLSVNVGAVRTIEHRGRTLSTGIYKVPVSGPVALTPFGLVGDERADARRYGEENHAVSAMPSEHYEYWSKQLGVELAPGHFGENLVLSGMLETQVRIGDVYQVGRAFLEVTQPRVPRRKIDLRMGFKFSQRFLESRRVGYFLRVATVGSIEASDAVQLISTDPNSPTIDEFLRITQFDTWDSEGLEGLLRARNLPSGWRQDIRDKVELARKAPGWLGLRPLRIAGLHQEGPVATLILECAQGKSLPEVLPGQVLPLALGSNARKRTLGHRYFVSHQRSGGGRYVLSGLSVAALAASTPQGLVSAMLPSDLAEGDAVLAGAPREGSSFSPSELGSALVVSEGVGLIGAVALLRTLPRREASALEVVHFRAGQSLPAVERELAGLARELGCTCRIQEGALQARSQFIDPAKLSMVVAAGPGPFVDGLRARVRGLPFRGLAFG